MAELHMEIFGFYCSALFLLKECHPEQHTCGGHLAQLGMTTRPQQQTIVTPGHPRTPMPQGPAPASQHN